jgi:hypothetical protein
MTDESKKHNIIALIKSFRQETWRDTLYDRPFGYSMSHHVSWCDTLYDRPFGYIYINLFMETSYFFYLLTNENILNEIYNNQINFGYQDVNYLIVLIQKHSIYYDLWRNSMERQIVTPILIPLQNKIKSMFIDYDEILNRLDKLKILKTKFIISKYNECLKYLEYAEEECLGSEKLLVTVSKINKYDKIIDNMVTNIIMSPIQKHIFCISTRINIIIPIYEMPKYEPIIKTKYGNMLKFISFRKLFDTLRYTARCDINIYDYLSI